MAASTPAVVERGLAICALPVLLERRHHSMLDAVSDRRGGSGRCKCRPGRAKHFPGPPVPTFRSSCGCIGVAQCDPLEGTNVWQGASRRGQRRRSRRRGTRSAGPLKPAPVNSSERSDEPAFSHLPAQPTCQGAMGARGGPQRCGWLTGHDRSSSLDQLTEKTPWTTQLPFARLQPRVLSRGTSFQLRRSPVQHYWPRPAWCRRRPPARLPTSHFGPGQAPATSD
jgi:hypothetical protein